MVPRVGQRDAPTMTHSEAANDEGMPARETGPGRILGALARLTNVGSLPLIIGLVIVWGVFEAISPVFLTSRNLVQLLLQLSPVGVIALGIVFTLLVAQIDLSVGSMSGVAAAILAILVVEAGLPVAVAIIAAILAGVLVGGIYAVAFNRLGVPSFVATLAGLLALLGLQLSFLGNSGAMNLPFHSFLGEFGNTAFLPAWLAYGLAAAAAGVVFWLGWSTRRARHAVGLRARPLAQVIGVAIATLVALEVIVWYLERDRGVAWMFAFFLGLVIASEYLLKYTKWGRAIYAVGGNVEAARRAGIKVERVYLFCFVACSVLAATGGVLFAANNVSANLQTGTGTVNLDAIAAAVIGGTSLFGGRGSAYSALFGMLVIQSITNGLALVSPSPDMLFIVTGVVLFLAVTLDAVTRRARKAQGRA
ncbi:MAG: sugar ABC transporter permease [Gammaproteobacteria bacterium]